MANKGLTKDIPTNNPDLEEKFLIFLWTKVNTIIRGKNIDVSNIPPWFMIQTDFEIINVESILGFTSIFVAICSSTSQPFGFTSRIKQPSL